MSLLTALIVQKSQILAGKYLVSDKKRIRPHLKGFQYQIWTSVKRLESSSQGRQTLAQVKIMSKTLKLQKLSNKSILKKSVQVRSKKVFP